MLLGKGSDTPPMGARVIVTWKPRGKKPEGRQRLDFILGDKEYVKGWNMGIASMKQREVANFTIRSDYGYGNAGQPPKIPSGATLSYEIELISWNTQEESLSQDGTLVGPGTGKVSVPNTLSCSKINPTDVMLGIDNQMHPTKELSERNQVSILQDKRLEKAKEPGTHSKSLYKIVVVPKYGIHQHYDLEDAIRRMETDGLTIGSASHVPRYEEPSTVEFYAVAEDHKDPIQLLDDALKKEPKIETHTMKKEADIAQKDKKKNKLLGSN